LSVIKEEYQPINYINMIPFYFSQLYFEGKTEREIKTNKIRTWGCLCTLDNKMGYITVVANRKKQDYKNK
jgi:hypothetical protein